ncbi:diguanylate cyclase [Aeromonas simiae]|uniref:diguanylate cyclase n=1 Tax=Aeromonas simiae TaxID=218936 RepID=A0A5J6X0S3_9GAMM|nr:diguanylate cyclase [Aeromonas simiae]
MGRSRIFRLNLSHLTLALTAFTLLAVLGNSFYATYRVQRELLIASTLESNRAYAAKLAESVGLMLDSAQRQLAFSAETLGQRAVEQETASSEVARLFRQTPMFNTVSVVSRDARIRALYPDKAHRMGSRATSRGAHQILAAREPIITDPFITTTGRYIISVTSPIFSTTRDYLGFISGNIYLESNNILSQLLSHHYYKDGTYIYVVDRSKTVIYHREAEQVGRLIKGNSAVDAVVQGKSGAVSQVNSYGIEMLTGYAAVENSHWGIIVQRPKAETLTNLNEQIKEILLASVPVNLLIIAGAWLASLFIARPLWQLACNTANMSNRDAQLRIAKVRAWYYEAAQLKQAILHSIGHINTRFDELHAETRSDPLTGLLNKRGIQLLLQCYEEEKIPFSVLALDVDHFKLINDTHGHDVGDRVLVALAALMQQKARKDDEVCRSGGEEFLIFLPHTPKAIAGEIAERLRRLVAEAPMEGVGAITLSIGVSEWHTGLPYHPSHAIKRADRALYCAKAAGRNRTELDLEG